MMYGKDKAMVKGGMAAKAKPAKGGAVKKGMTMGGMVKPMGMSKGGMAKKGKK